MPGYIRDAVTRVQVRGAAVNGRKRYAGAGIPMSRFGKSMQGAAEYEFFEFDVKMIAQKVRGFVKGVKTDGVGCLRSQFEDQSETLEYGVEH
jgi:dihydroxyacetone synthase